MPDKPHDSFGVFLRGLQRKNTLNAATVTTVINLTNAIAGAENEDKILAVREALQKKGFVSNVVAFEPEPAKECQVGYLFGNKKTDAWFAGKGYGIKMYVDDYHKELAGGGQSFSSGETKAVHIAVLLFPSHWKNGEDFVYTALQLAFSEIATILGVKMSDIQLEILRLNTLSFK